MRISRKSQYNMATPSFLDISPPVCLNPLFFSNKSLKFWSLNYAFIRLIFLKVVYYVFHFLLPLWVLRDLGRKIDNLFEQKQSLQYILSQSRPFSYVLSKALKIVRKALLLPNILNSSDKKGLSGIKNSFYLPNHLGNER